MTRKRVAPIALGLIAIGVGWYLCCPCNDTEPAPIAAALPAPPQVPIAPPPMRAAVAPPREPVTTAAVEPPALHPPRRDQLIAEVRANPHVAPRSLLLWAASLAAPMHEALADVNAARPLFQSFAACTRAVDSPENVRAVCLSNAVLLGRSHPTLTADAESLWSETDEAVTRLARR